jgi:tetratricopeptide (TPR) repeat protein
VDVAQGKFADGIDPGAYGSEPTNHTCYGEHPGATPVDRHFTVYEPVEGAARFNKIKHKPNNFSLEALDRDANSSMAHFVMGVLRQNRLSEAKTELETAIALDRNDPPAFHQLGQTLMLMGQREAGIPLIERAMLLNPRDASVATIIRGCARAIYFRDIWTRQWTSSEKRVPQIAVSGLFIYSSRGHSA